MLKHSASIPAPVNLGNAWICRLSKITMAVSSSFCMHGQDNQHKVLAGLPNRPPAPFDAIPKVPFAVTLNRLPRNCFLVFASCARFPWRTAAHRFNLFALSEHALCRSLALKLCKRHSETNHPYRAYTRKSGGIRRFSCAITANVSEFGRSVSMHALCFKAFFSLSTAHSKAGVCFRLAPV